jgi:phosphonate transport system ATP-binding protein
LNQDRLSMIRIVELTKEFGGSRVLRGVNLEVARGEALFVLGPSGAGKSTLLRCLNGLYWPSDGSVWIGGVKLERGNLAAIRRRIGFIFQGYQLISNLSVLRNVLIGRLAEKPGWSLIFSKHDVRLARQAIDAVGLGDKVHARVSELSGGQKQRVGIARALVHDPEVLLADEPISSLDPVTGREILTLLRSIGIMRGMTLLCNLHDVSLAIETADRLIGLRDGVVAFDRRPEDLTTDDLNRLYGATRLAPPSGNPVTASADQTVPGHTAAAAGRIRLPSSFSSSEVAT